MHWLHTGVDFAAPSGTHILTAADGRVAFAGPASGYRNLILIEHTVNGQQVASGYAHMYADGIHVHAGDTVTAGRNDRGDGHGRPTPPVATALEAQLSSIGAALVCQMLLTALDKA